MNTKENESNLENLPFMDDELSIEQRVEDLLQRLNRNEKFKLLTGRHRWETKPIDRLGIKPFLMTDGPHGVAPHSSGGEECTYFPVGICRAATWNPSLSYKFGKGIAEEVKGLGLHMILGPGVNIIRTPLCGRNFEYQTEDPYLNKKLAVEVIKGVQNQEIAACVKHYICNNQEKNRYTYSAEVSRRALEEIYYPTFKASVEEADVWSVMGAYNKINGTYACAHENLLKETFMDKWGFRGFVVSDWNATHLVDDLEDCLKAGLSLEMPRAKKFKRRYLKEAFKENKFSEEELDRNVGRLLWVMFKVGLFDKERNREPTGLFNVSEHQTLARHIAEEGITLLKNQDNVLPLNINEVESIAILGPNADKEMAEGGGSSAVKPPYEITPMEGIAEKCKGKIKITDSVSEADYVFLVVGLNHEPGNDCENADRTSIELPIEQIELINNTVDQNSNTIIILVNGGPIGMTGWINKVSAIIEAWYPGMEGGRVLADIIFGDCTPSGKLPITFPKTLSDSPAHISDKTYPGYEGVIYEEDILVGYRYFDSKGLEPLFPFGHGLSYTTFSYESLKIDKNEIGERDTLTVILDISNAGDREGAETIQLYIRDQESRLLRPEKELKRFEKVVLNPSEKRTLTFKITTDDLAFFDDKKNTWMVEDGVFDLLIGSSSRDIRLQKSFKYIS